MATIILIRIIGDGDGDGDDEGEPFINSRKLFNPMSAKDLEATIRYMNPTMNAFRRGQVIRRHLSLCDHRS